MSFRRVIRLAAAFCVSAAVCAAAQAQQPARPAPIDRNGVIILIRSTLLALDEANKTGNYSVLRDMGAPRFQLNSDARLTEIFAQQRRDGLDLSAVAVLDPQLSVLPEIGENGVMHLAGFFPSAPNQVNFDLYFAPIEGKWRIFGISVGIGSSSPAAPAASPIPSPSPTPKTKPKPSTP
ncbi:MAG: hypothetical protein ABSC25_05775 [Roseiarcus sp.]|jgi:hypothetical protein